MCPQLSANIIVHLWKVFTSRKSNAATKYFSGLRQVGLKIWECCTATTSKLGRSDIHNLYKLTVLRPNSIYPAKPNDFEISSSSIDAHMATMPEIEIISSLTRPGASAKNAVQRLLLLTAAASKESPNDDGNGAIYPHP